MAETTNQEDYVQKAERIIKGLTEGSRERGGAKMATDTQLRKILSLSNRILSRLQVQGLGENSPLEGELLAMVQSLRVQIVYQSARLEAVKHFQERTGLLDQLKKVETFGHFIAFHRYLEALTAYQKYYASLR